MTTFFWGLFFFFFLLAGFFLAALEGVLLFTSPLRIEKWPESGKKEADFLKNQFLKNPGWYLTGLRLLRVLFFVGLLMLLFLIFKSLIGGWPQHVEILGTLIILAVGAALYFLVFEVGGKSYGILHDEQLIFWAAWVARLAGVVFGPLVILVNWLGRLLWSQAAREFSQGGLVLSRETRFLGVPSSGEVTEAEKKEMLSSVFEFGQQMVKNVMTPRIEMVCLEVASSREEILSTVEKCGYSRIPVYENEIDNISGVLYVKDLFKTGFLSGPFHLEEILRPPQFVPETKRVDKLLLEMKVSKNHLALVVDEYGGISGLVTFEDLIEEIVGEINDEYDQDQPTLWQASGAGNFVLSGELSIKEANKILGTLISEKNYDTIGGFILGALGRIPKPQESLTVENYKFIVEEVEDRRIKKIKVTRNA
jgi:CBS domain containing-hemolysin-like protein